MPKIKMSKTKQMTLDRNGENESVLKYQSPSPSPSILHVHFHLSFFFDIFISASFLSIFSHHTLSLGTTLLRLDIETQHLVFVIIQMKKHTYQTLLLLRISYQMCSAMEDTFSYIASRQNKTRNLKLSFTIMSTSTTSVHLDNLTMNKQHLLDLSHILTLKHFP